MTKPKREDGILGWFVFGSACVALGYALRISVLVDAWRIFVVPLGVPALSFWHMAGLSAAVGLVLYANRALQKRPPSERPVHDAAAEALGRVFATLLLWGWVYLVAHMAGLS